MGTMIIDGQPVPFTDEKQILQVIRKAGIDLPTFCYHSELSVYGACRMCMVEDEWGTLMTSCSTPPKDGMKIRTNTQKLRKHRRMILELILASHDRDCTVCEKNGRCRLQELAMRFGVKEVRFDNDRTIRPLDLSSPAIVRNPNKCILCGDCVRMCAEVQGVGALGFAWRGADIEVSTAFGRPLAQTDCVGCGQCRLVCPTGALTIRKDTDPVWQALHDPGKRVVAQIAPAVRVALGEEFGFAAGEPVFGKTVAALRKLGFDQVFDTGLGADLTVLEESAELLRHLDSGTDLPLFTSCCPGWFNHVEKRHPDLLAHVSSCRSPMMMFGAVLKEQSRGLDRLDGRQTVMVAIMPCTAKKGEAARPEYEQDGVRDTDIVITTQELALMIQEAGIAFAELEDEAADMPLGLTSGAGQLFGSTGGVTEAVLRHLDTDKSMKGLRAIQFSGVRGLEGVREAEARVGERHVKVAIAHGLKQADNLVRAIRRGDVRYDFVEVMACAGGCICGAGQPLPATADVREKRRHGIHQVDGRAQIKRSEENPAIFALYNGLLQGKKHLLHREGAHAHD
jgi:NADH-quinone oxidoreductase subunit G